MRVCLFVRSGVLHFHFERSGSASEGDADKEWRRRGAAAAAAAAESRIFITLPDNKPRFDPTKINRPSRSTIAIVCTRTRSSNQMERSQTLNDGGGGGGGDA